MGLRSKRQMQAALPMHLTLAMMPWFGLNSILRLSTAELQFLKQNTRLQGKKSGEFAQLWLRLLDERPFAEHVEREAKSRAAEFLQGVLRYQETPFTRESFEYPVRYAQGAMRLLEVGGDDHADPVLLVPSLINRYYILDLSPRLSFARYLRDHGKRVYLVDWGEPSSLEEPFNCADYIRYHLLPAVARIRQMTGKKPILAGYCMGGLLALGFACAYPQQVRALACLSTPWDFSAPDVPPLLALCGGDDALAPYLSSDGMVSAETIHTLFHLANPFAFQTKLREFAAMKEGSQAFRDFLAVEHWVQDGVKMTRGVAQDCLVSWPGQNATAHLTWTIGARVVNPSKLSLPVFLAVPQEDRIVPSSCALPLAKQCRNATLIQPEGGHIGMIVGKNRRNAMWEPFRNWADQVA